MKFLQPYFFFAVLVGLMLQPVSACANSPYELTIINHFDQPLTFNITINPHVVPDLPQNFRLSKDTQIKTAVLDIGKESYLRVDDSHSHSAFWGVNVENKKVRVHGYLSKGIAFSADSEKVVFCTPEEFKKHRSCIRTTHG